MQGAGRMLEKLVDYAAEGAQWPLTACILDPVRASVICSGPTQMLQVRIFIAQYTAVHLLIILFPQVLLSNIILKTKYESVVTM